MSVAASAAPAAPAAPSAASTSIGRDEAAATAAHNAALNGGPSALRHARDAVRIWPEHIEYRLALARALLSSADRHGGAGATAEAEARATPRNPENADTATSAGTTEDRRAEGFRHCKTAVSTARRALRALRKSPSKNRSSPDAAAAAAALDGGADLLLARQRRRLTAFIADAYGLMGDLHKTTGGTKLPHAISAYTLALKHDPARSSVRASLAWCMDEISGARTGNHGGRKPEEVEEAAAAAPSAAASAADIESLLSNHTVLSRSDALDFGCTMCGECCRHADYIFLSPIDVWRLLRAPAMHLKRKAWKDAMRARSVTAAAAGTDGAKTSRKSPWERMLTDLNGALQGALQWSSKDDLPLCYLSPKRASGGRCHFAFPLFEHDGRLVAPQASLALEAQRADGGGVVGGGGADGKVATGERGGGETKVPSKSGRKTGSRNGRKSENQRSRAE